ncbi:universal stress protein UspA [Rufibacter radiotolerans]|uniref:Universal stress protein UspA n=1 Tax=Rufibacter radiotolerans TaxID=1379910 RepID=A0A0H4W541_9BACT|nr:universal stress protein [Rufibacter radiotolerans]AKQ45541.1 universal stress protein UspA [Rufibacter radiotolerans]
MEKQLKVMVPVDFMPVSFKALEFLGLLMDQMPIETHLVHVIQVNATDWAGSSESSETLDRAEMRAMEQTAEEQFAQLRQQVDFKFTQHVLHGGLTTSLANYANLQQVDLVIMGTEGADGWYEKISGSEAQHVVRYTDVPVITIHQNVGITPIHNILWVADFAYEKQPQRSISLIKVLQRIFGAKIHLLQILQKEDAHQELALRENMMRFANNLQLENYELHFHRDFKVPTGVRNFNQESEKNLVVIGTHARKGVNHLFYGSIAETLVNHCIRPLLTYHLK